MSISPICWIAILRTPAAGEAAAADRVSGVSPHRARVEPWPAVPPNVDWTMKKMARWRTLALPSSASSPSLLLLPRSTGLQRPALGARSGASAPLTAASTAAGYRTSRARSMRCRAAWTSAGASGSAAACSTFSARPCATCSKIPDCTSSMRGASSASTAPCADADRRATREVVITRSRGESRTWLALRDASSCVSWGVASSAFKAFSERVVSWGWVTATCANSSNTGRTVSGW
mmetsp:Transcript_25518/g.69230  ORF Transcript_25518/g.69230 Transcript_25518/m.69230 type:complete len:234 (+) Transcript_25518:6752-7453(+)